MDWVPASTAASVWMVARTILFNGCWGGSRRPAGWIDEEVTRARYEYARRLETGEQVVVGVNAFREEGEETKINIFRLPGDMPAKRRKYVRNYKKNRDRVKVKRALDVLLDEAKKGVNLFIPILEAVEARATLGEISDTLRQAENFKIRIG